MSLAITITDSVHMEGSGEFYLSRRKEPVLKGDTRRTVGLPRPWSMMIGRIVDRLWVVNRYFSASGCHSLMVCAAQGHRLIRVELPSGVKIRFRLAYLVGWCSDVRMHTDISLAIVRMSNKAIFVQEAVGPGVLLFEACGNPTTVSGAASRMAADRMILWLESTIFEISGAHSWLDMYMNPPLVSIANEGQVIIDSDDSKHLKRSGIMRMIRRFYWP